jgi:signal transduction histidine kinase
LFRTTGLRLAALQTVLFILTFVVAGAAGFAIVRRAEYRAAHAEIEEQEDDFTDRVAHLGLARAIEHFNREHRDEAHDFRVEDANGRLLGGGMPPPPAVPGKVKYWTVYAAPGTRSPHRAAGPVLAYVHPEPGGLRLTVGEYLAPRERQDDDLILAIVMAAGGVAGTGMAAGVWISHRVQRQIDRMANAVDRFGAGDRDARIHASQVPTSDLDDLTEALNRMMARETQLVDGLKQATWAIAHDLRRPLTHHNQAIADALGGPRDAESYAAALAAAAARVDEVLETFKALLHIAELEAGAPGLKLEPVDLDATAARVVEAYTPAAEAGGRTLRYDPSSHPAPILAEARVLGRMIANLIDNALAHTPAGACVWVSVDASGPTLVVTDNGRGVPEGQLERIFDRFVRLDSSRSTEGAGLGLALAAAAARAFRGRIHAEDARPGLRVIAEFERADAID